MSEKPPESKTKEELATEQEMEEMARYEAWMSEHPTVDVPQNSPETCAERVAECEAMMDNFEQTHDLDSLRAITQFSSREERESSHRQPALDALAPIFKRLKHLNSQRALPNETRNALGARYERLSQAVGNITVDKDGGTFDVVVHNRQTHFPS